MIKYFKHRDIDKQRWDDCVNRSANALVYANSFYLDVVSPGWDALVLNDYDAVFPLTHRKKYGIAYICQPPFTQQLGMFSKDENNFQLLEEFIHAIPSHFRYADIFLNSALTEKLPSYKNSSIQMMTHHLDLKRPYSEIAQNYSENLKRNIRKANFSALSIQKSISALEIIELFRTNRGREINNVSNSDYVILEKLLDALQKRDLLTVLKAVNEKEETCAGAVFVHSHNSSIFLFSGNTEEGKTKGAMSLLIDYFIRNNSDNNAYLDFEGSVLPSLARFYKSFGSDEVVYLHLKLNRLPGIFRWLKK
ncbi:MAG: hypothetical protein DWQ44_03870 [Bacteroidetes bacterium]|nr:MAG: hypothetical protein DWQ33_00165 [Bacteroidota bacterium]REK05058.1 MAG: hypothetical protein DWQ39_07560 [Bacteroidota bacterium]REK35552.1 MAG: hypothetical protein DWQ44_03870 [Bacteroidota bacterium]REK51655.1 MAG: hypothetical protein DWQ48_00445 [Bacteroidota bacterium]